MKRILLFCLIIFGIILNWTPVYPGEEELNNSLISEVMGGNPEMVQHWVDQGADPNAEVQSGQYAGRSLLYMAARAGHIECVKVLLSGAADMWEIASYTNVENGNFFSFF